MQVLAFCLHDGVCHCYLHHFPNSQSFCSLSFHSRSCYDGGDDGGGGDDQVCGGGRGCLVWVLVRGRGSPFLSICKRMAFFGRRRPKGIHTRLMVGRFCNCQGDIGTLELQRPKNHISHEVCSREWVLAWRFRVSRPWHQVPLLCIHLDDHLCSNPKGIHIRTRDGKDGIGIGEDRICISQMGYRICRNRRFDCRGGDAGGGDRVRGYERCPDLSGPNPRFWGLQFCTHRVDILCICPMDNHIHQKDEEGYIDTNCICTCQTRLRIYHISHLRNICYRAS